MALDTSTSLPENGSLPSVWLFAECRKSGTRQRASLPSVNRRTLSKEQTLGKELFAECQTLGKVNTLGKNAFAECLALGKEWHSAKMALRQPRLPPLNFAECLRLGTRQINQKKIFTECQIKRHSVKGCALPSAIRSGTWQRNLKFF